MDPGQFTGTMARTWKLEYTGLKVGWMDLLESELSHLRNETRACSSASSPSPSRTTPPTSIEKSGLKKNPRPFLFGRSSSEDDPGLLSDLTITPPSPDPPSTASILEQERDPTPDSPSNARDTPALRDSNQDPARGRLQPTVEECSDDEHPSAQRQDSEEHEKHLSAVGGSGPTVEQGGFFKEKVFPVRGQDHGPGETANGHEMIDDPEDDRSDHLDRDPTMEEDDWDEMNTSLGEGDNEGRGEDEDELMEDARGDGNTGNDNNEVENGGEDGDQDIVSLADTAGGVGGTGWDRLGGGRATNILRENGATQDGGSNKQGNRGMEYPRSSDATKLYPFVRDTEENLQNTFYEAPTQIYVDGTTQAEKNISDSENIRDESSEDDERVRAWPPSKHPWHIVATQIMDTASTTNDVRTRRKELDLGTNAENRVTILALLGVGYDGALPKLTRLRGDPVESAGHYVEYARTLKQISACYSRLNCFAEIVAVSWCMVLLHIGHPESVVDPLMPRSKRLTARSNRRLRTGVKMVHQIIVELSEAGWGDRASELFLLGV